MTTQTRVLVTGAGGFIGHHLTRSLVERGYWVRGVDVKHPEYERSAAHEFELLDLRRWAECLCAAKSMARASATTGFNTAPSARRLPPWRGCSRPACRARTGRRWTG